MIIYAVTSSDGQEFCRTPETAVDIMGDMAVHFEFDYDDILLQLKADGYVSCAGDNCTMGEEFSIGIDIRKIKVRK